MMPNVHVMSGRMEYFARLRPTTARYAVMSFLGPSGFVGSAPGVEVVVVGAVVVVVVVGSTLVVVVDPRDDVVVVEASNGQLEDEMRLAMSHAGVHAPPVIDSVRRCGGILPQQGEIVSRVCALEGKGRAA